MATHDYVIANASGAAVRADLNNALAAIVSNNSGSSEPGTTYAFQWWADTNASQLKLRNAANDDWVVIQELDGTMLMENGTVGSPGLAFASDLDTGFFRPAANQLAVATNGIERVEFGTTEVVFNDGGADIDLRVEGDNQANLFFIDAGNDRVGIGAAPGTFVEIDSTAPYVTIKNNTHEDTSGGRESKIIFEGEQSGGEITSLAEIEVSHEGTADDQKGQLILKVNSGAEGASPGESMRIDSSGRLLVGTSSSDTSRMGTSAYNPQFQIKGAWTNGTQSITCTDDYPVLWLNGTAGTSSGAGVARISFNGYDGSNYTQAAQIDAQLDAAASANSVSGRLVFSTTLAGTAPTERMRIDSSGRVLVHTSTAAPYSDRFLSIGDVTDASATFEIRSSPTNGYSSIVFSDSTADSTNAFIGAIEYNHANNTLAFKTNATERLKIRSDGRLLAAGVYAETTGSSANVNVQSDGLLQRSVSSIKYKKDVETLQDSYADALLNVRPVWYKSKCSSDNPDWGHWGFIAEELAEIDPRLVIWKTAELTYDEKGAAVKTACEPEAEGVQYDRFTPHLLNLIKRQQAAIKTLETKVAALEAG